MTARNDQIKAVVLVCTLKGGRAKSSSDKLAREVVQALSEHEVTADVIRVVNQNVKFGVSSDEGDGDGWPAIRRKIMSAQILVVATPIWMGQPASVAKVVLERLDAELDEKDDQGRMLTMGKVPR